MLSPASTPPISGYLTVKDAALVLGVCRKTLRNWDRTGKVKARRHPVNGYRLYLREDLEVILRGAGSGRTKTGKTVTPPKKVNILLGGRQAGEQSAAAGGPAPKARRNRSGDEILAAPPVGGAG